MTTRGQHTRDLVLAAAQDYDWDDLRPFVGSLRATGFAGEIRFFGSGLSRSTIRQLENAGVDVSRPRRLRVKVGGYKFEPYARPSNRWSWHLQGVYWHLARGLARFSHDRRRAINRYTAALSNVEISRYFWYHEYLSRTPSRYRNVMLTDVRDVVFFDKPFDFAMGDAACFFLEDGRIPINKDIHNTKWIVDAYGPGAIVELGDYPISCSGVTIGTASAVREYLAVMVEHLSRLTRQAGGVDQGVHNYVLHKGLVGKARVIPNRNGPVLTVGIMSADEALELVDSRASVVRVLHQYDRHPELAQALQERFRTIGTWCSAG